MARLGSTDILGNLKVRGSTELNENSTIGGKTIATLEDVSNATPNVELKTIVSQSLFGNGDISRDTLLNLNSIGILRRSGPNTISVINGLDSAFVKGDGSLDSTTYLTSHQSLSNYYTKIQTDGLVNAKANDNDVVKLTDDSQNIAGNKTFNGTNYIGGLKVLQQSKNVIGTTANTTVFDTNKVWFQQGALFYGTAAAAGLLTRGISGINSEGSSKDNLYINYDGTNTYNSGRQMVLQAGSIGTHYGNNLYQYAAARGDAVKGWVESKGYLTSESLLSYYNKTESDSNYLGKTAKAADSSKLNGESASYYAKESEVVNLGDEQIITGLKTFENSAWVSGTQTTGLKIKVRTGASQYGSLSVIKEGTNSGIGLRFDQVDGTPRLIFRGSATAGAMVWSQPETGSELYLDVSTINFRNAGNIRVTGGAIRPDTNNTGSLGTSALKWGNVYTTKINNGGDITIPTSSGTMALTSNLNDYYTKTQTDTKYLSAETDPTVRSWAKIVDTSAVPVTKGGTGLTSIPANGLLKGNGTSNVSTIVGTEIGQVLVWTSGGWVAQQRNYVENTSADVTLNNTAYYNNYIRVDSTSARTVLVPTDAIHNAPIGTEYHIEKANTGSVTISGINVYSANNSKTIGIRYGVVTLKKVASNTWTLFGALS